ncbi:TetR/AcrR family transcriptional regulator [Embleya sp. NBC_00896]|uniref:TetR/AcrR family transcriptional regulator n=1 Tax=Embleya sp. NBC_00896 TaxID=2975961 RepID=UPI003866CF0E|nr:TetR/AcrR family transcriptional regulator [Embleya sp. NBC_00896]
MSTGARAGHVETALLVTDYRQRPRKRGVTLERAISEAVIAELGERGYGALTFEGVAARAGTGKSALYRRWPDKMSMTADALSATLPNAETVPLVGELRADLITYLETISHAMSGTLGLGIRLLCGEISRHVEFADMWQKRVIDPWQELLTEVLTDAVARGEARPGAVAPECVSAGPSVLCHRFSLTSVPMSREEIESLVDNALIPMMAVRN